MIEVGAKVSIIAAEKRTYKGKNGMKISSQIIIDNCKSEVFDALIIPGGFAPDYMRRKSLMIDFVKKMYEKNKLIDAICHAPWMLISAGILNKKQITSFYSIKDDLVNAGGYWIDQEVVIDGNIVTSRKPDDLPAFSKAFIDVLSLVDLNS